ncbi:MAG TPA: peptidylprolyl isomerase [Vicinamibacterales bacterium]|jgi:parvulin-like peptidyl-prolyl isomerase
MKHLPLAACVVFVLAGTSPALAQQPAAQTPVVTKPAPAAAAPAPAAAAKTPLGTEVIDAVLVKVNGDIFTKSDLESRQIDVLRQKLNGDVDQSMLKNDEQLKKQLDQVTPQILVNAIDEMLLVQKGRELGLKLGDEQFKQVVANIRKEQGLEDDKKFQAALAQENMTMDDLRRQMERRMQIEQVQRQEVGSKLTITEEEARQYYQNHPEEFTEPTTISLREILVAVPADKDGNFNAGLDHDAQQKIADARARILKGESFAKVAAEVSDSPSKSNGGSIGPFSRNDMSPQLQQIVDKMKPGDVTQPLRTQHGYQLFQLASMTPQKLQPFDTVRDVVTDKVTAARTQTEMRKFLARLRSQAIIEWKNQELKQVYEKEVTAENSATTTGTTPGASGGQ